MNYKSERWKRLRRAILARDGYMDKELSRFGKMVEANTVHHIFPAEDYPQYQWCDWNLMSVSHKTHNELHDRNTGDLTDKGKAIMKRVARQRGITL